MGSDPAATRWPPAPDLAQTLLRFPPPKGLWGSKPYITRLYIDEHNLYYEGRERNSLQEGSRRSMLLYTLK